MLLYSFDVDTLFIQNGYIVVKSQKEYVRHTHYFEHIITLETGRSVRSVVYVSDNFHTNRKKAVNIDELKKNIMHFIDKASKRLLESPPYASQGIKKAFKITLTQDGWRYENDYLLLVVDKKEDESEKLLNEVALLENSLSYNKIDSIYLWKEIELKLERNYIEFNADNEIERLSLYFEGGNETWYFNLDLHIFTANKILVVINTSNSEINVNNKVQKQFTFDYNFNFGHYGTGYKIATYDINDNIKSVDVLYP